VNREYLTDQTLDGNSFGFPCGVAVGADVPVSSGEVQVNTGAYIHT